MSKATPEQLRGVITDMDALAQGGFGQIASMARLARLALEQPGTYASASGMDAIAGVLAAIQSKAEDIDNCLNALAEGVGCNHVDSTQRKRWDAMRKAFKSANDGGLEPCQQ